MRALDVLLFVVLPYAAIVLAVVATFERYRRHGYSCTSHSTQFLENRRHFWALVPFHVGILAVLAGHVIGFLIPRGVLAWNAIPLRLPDGALGAQKEADSTLFFLNLPFSEPDCVVTALDSMDTRWDKQFSQMATVW